MKRVLLCLSLLSVGAAGHASTWSDLWSRPEQQSLAQRQQAFTEIQGQQYAAAAEHLKGFADPVSTYNRGNALARAGDLKGALDAYDQLLKEAGGDPDLRRDAQHNRDLVAKQLKDQQQGDKSGKKGDSGDKSDKSDKGDKGDKGDKSDKGDAKAPQSKPADDKAGQQAEQQAAQAARKDEQSGKDGRLGADGEARPGDKEKAESMDQWLRWIPDDPSGLLRRKFMIEHMLQHHEEPK